MTQPYPLTRTLPTPSTRKRLPLRLRSNGLIGSAELSSNVPTKSQLCMRECPACDRIVFACHPAETGLRICLPEKSQDNTAFDPERSVLCSPVRLAIIAKYGHCSRISAQSEGNSSAVQTAWRSKRDSNSQYLFEPLSADVSISCRLQNTAREFHAKT